MTKKTKKAVKPILNRENVLGLLKVHPYTMAQLTKVYKVNPSVIANHISQLRKAGHTIEYERHYNQYFYVKPRGMENILNDMKLLIAEASKLLEE